MLLRWCFSLFILLVSLFPVGAYASSSSFIVYEDGLGGYYVGSQPVNMVMHGDVATTIQVDLLNQYYQLWQSQGEWYLDILSPEEWRELENSLPASDVSVSAEGLDSQGKSVLNISINSATNLTIANGQVDSNEPQLMMMAARTWSSTPSRTRQPKPVSQLVAAKRGELTVSPSGSAEFRYSLSLPDRGAGLKPNLSINYSSMGGDGIAGLGGFIGGLSSVHRCGKNKIQDGVNGAGRVFNTPVDRLCLDGQRLLLIGKKPGQVVSDSDYWKSGATYYLENDNYARINEVNGRFEMTTKSKEVWTYGSSTLSRLLTSDGTVWRWGISNRKDKFGTAIDYYYLPQTQTGSGELLINKIRYNHLPSSHNPISVQFSYIDRARDKHYYYGGTVVSATKALDQVVVYVNGIEDVRYELGYETGAAAQQPYHLSYIQACHAITQCLYPTYLNWMEGLHNVSLPESGVNTALKMKEWDVFDMDGDGNADLIYQDENKAWWFKKSMTGAKKSLGLQGNNQLRIDVNGDGILDALIGPSVFGYYGAAYFPRINDTCQDDNWLCQRVGRVGGTSLQTGVSTVKVGSLKTEPSIFKDFSPIHVDDYNYNGITNLVGIGSTRTVRKGVAHVELKDVSLRNHQTIAGLLPDSSGAGVKKMAYLSEPYSYERCVRCGGRGNDIYKTVHVDSALTFEGHTVSGGNKNIKPQIVDLDGSGLEDVAYYIEDGKTLYYYLASGSAAAPYPLQQQLTFSNTIKQLYFFDANNDGVQDILVQLKTGTCTTCVIWRFYTGKSAISSESPFISWSLVNASFSSKDYTDIKFADANSDGIQEIFARHKDGFDLITLNAKGSTLEAVSSIEQGFDNGREDIQISYAALNTKAVDYFSGGNGDNVDWIEPMGNIYLVNKIRRTSHGSGYITYLYRYHGLRYEMNGRGWLGFETFSEVDVFNRIEHRNTYYQAFPLTGKLKTESRFTVTGSDYLQDLPLFIRHYEYLTSDNADGGSQTYLRKITQSDFNVNTDGGSNLLRDLSVLNTVDAWGNILKQDTTEKDYAVLPPKTYNTAKVNTYYSARYGLPSQHQVTKSKDGIATTRYRSFTYNSNYALSSETNNAKTDYRSTQYYSYDSSGNVTQRVNSVNKGKFRIFTASYTGGMLTEDRSVEEKLRNYYRYNGGAQGVVKGPIRKIQTITPVGNQYLELDALGREVSFKDESGATRTTTYSSCISCPTGGVYMRTVKAPDTPEEITIFNRFDEEIATKTKNINGGYDMTMLVREGDGRLHYSYAPSGSYTGGPKTTYIYDKAGRLMSRLSARDIGLNRESWRYDGATVIYTDGEGNTSSKTYSSGQRIVASKDNRGVSVSYDYTPWKELKSTTVESPSGKAVTTKLEYNAAGWKWKLIDPSTGTSTYDYDGNGLLISQTDAKNQTVTFKYDAFDRKVEETRHSSGKICFRYNAEGLLEYERRFSSTSASCDSSSNQYQAKNTYTKGQLSSRVVRIDGQSYAFAYQYKANSHAIEKLTYPTNKAGKSIWATTTYVNGYVHQIKDQDNRILKTVTSYDHWGQAKDITYGNGVTQAKSIIAANGRASSLSFKKGTSHLVSVDYGYDHRDLVRTRELNYGGYGQFNDEMLYDGNQQLTKVKRNGRDVHDISYDDFGNIEAQTGTERSGTYVYDTANPYRLKSHTTGGVARTFSYDNNGNITSTGTQTLVYADNNKPTKISGYGHTSEFEYGVNQQRYKRIDRQKDSGLSVAYLTHYVDGLYERVTRQGDAGQVVTAVTIDNYYLGDIRVTYRSGTLNNQAITARDEYYSHSDDIGNVLAVTNSSGQLAACYYYEPYGSQVEICKNNNAVTFDLLDPTRHGFTGHEMLNELGLIHMNGRVYDQNMGRFLQADPLIQDLREVVSFNRYAYVWNNPVNKIDPSGYRMVDPENTGNPHDNNEPDSRFGSQADRDSHSEMGLRLGRGKGTKVTVERAQDGSWNMTYTNEVAPDHIRVSEPTYTDLNPLPSEEKQGLKSSYPVLSIYALARLGMLAINSLRTSIANSALGRLGLGGNPFEGKTAKQIAEMFKSKKFRESGDDPINGYGGYTNPRTGRSYHIDPKEYGRYREPNHVDVNRPRKYKGLDKKKLPYRD